MIATGATIIAAAKSIREKAEQQKDQKGADSAKHTVGLLKKECNAEVVISPSYSSFSSVEQYHQSFEPVTDQHVI
jgi:predicted phosphoribosyltransferase